jgi:putative FmdB family regulatory protein
MPNYNYECDACKDTIEIFQSIKENALTTCNKCKQETLRRVITGGTGIIFAESFKGHHEKIKRENKL